MKNRIFCLLVALVMLFGTIAMTLTSCGPVEEPCTNHVDADGDGVCDTEGCDVEVACEHVDADNSAACDKCGAEILVGNFTWDPTVLKFALNMCSHNGELGSGLKRYLAGANSDGSDVVKEVSKRNIKAAMFTKTSLIYEYWSDGNKDVNIKDGDDQTLHGWGNSQDYIYTLLKGGSDQPDMYSTFLNGLVRAQVNRAFANLKTTKVENHFRFANDADYFDTVGDSEGYMAAAMQSLTMNQNKMYILASDYFTDAVRAFFIVPVNAGIMNEIGDAYKKANNVLPATGAFKDRDGDGDFDIEDYVQLIWDREWTYDNMAIYSEAAYADLDGDGKKSIKDQYGFVMEIGSGFSASGVLFASAINFMTATKTADGDIKYNYSGIVKDAATGAYVFDENAADVAAAKMLFDFDAALTTLFTGAGLMIADTQSQAKGEAAGTFNFEQAWSNPENLYRPNGDDNNLNAIRVKFASNEILFGGFTMTGNVDLNYEGDNNDYQDVRNGQGLAIAPGPLYRGLAEGEQFADKNAANYYDYTTHIHTIARMGAISVNTTKFSQCSAFLDYQSTHSQEILNEYYKEKLSRAAGSENDNAKIMEFLRTNVRTLSAALFECILDTEKPAQGQTGSKFVVYIKGKDRNLRPNGYLVSMYTTYAPKKQEYIDIFTEKWASFPEVNDYVVDAE